MGSFTEGNRPGTVPLLHVQPGSPQVQRSQFSNTSAQGVAPWDASFRHVGPHPVFAPPPPPAQYGPNMTTVPSRPFMGPTSGFSFTSTQPVPAVHGSMVPHAGIGGGIGGGGRGWDQPAQSESTEYPFFVKVLMVFSLLVLFVNAPLAVWFSYMLFTMASLLAAGPLAGIISLCAIFLVEWGHRCGCLSRPERMVKVMKFLCMAASVFDVVGVIVMPLVMYSLVCPDDIIDHCEHDKPSGQAFSVAAAFVMAIHMALCILLRMQAKNVVSIMSRKEFDSEESVFRPNPQDDVKNNPHSLVYHPMPSFRSPSLSRISMQNMNAYTLQPSRPMG